MKTHLQTSEELEKEERNKKVNGHLDHLEGLFRQMPHNPLIDEAHMTLSSLRAVLVYYDCC